MFINDMQKQSFKIMWENVLINNKEMLYELFFFYMIVFNGYFVFFVVRFLILYRKKINLDSRY